MKSVPKYIEWTTMTIVFQIKMSKNKKENKKSRRGAKPKKVATTNPNLKS